MSETPDEQAEENPTPEDAVLVTCDIRIISYLDTDGEEKQRIQIETGASVITLLGLLEHAKHCVLTWNEAS